LANHKSALKRTRQSQAARVRNLTQKTKAKTAVKEIRAALGDKSVEQARENFKKTVSILQKTASKGVIHKKKAARKISRLARAIHRSTDQKSA